MQGIEPIIDQARPQDILARWVRNRKIPHALLFTGIDGTGRYQTAIKLAMTLNCGGQVTTPTASPGRPSPGNQTELAALPACGVCPSCKKIFSGQHPDILHIKPSGRAIKIDQIRSLRHTLSLKPHEADHRIAILEAAEVMTLPAINALLKILEEPPQQTALILIAPKSSDLLPTVVSRCQEVRFTQATNDQIISELVDRHGVAPSLARTAAAMAEGSYKTANEMVSEKWLRLRKWMITEMTALGQSVSAGQRGSIRRAMALAELFASDRQTLSRLTVVIKSWLRDLAVWPFLPMNLINQDVAGPIGALAAAVGTDLVFTAFADLETLEKQIQANANPRLALEVYFIKLTQRLSTPSGTG